MVDVCVRCPMKKRIYCGQSSCAMPNPMTTYVLYRTIRTYGWMCAIFMVFGQYCAAIYHVFISQYKFPSASTERKQYITCQWWRAGNGMMFDDFLTCFRFFFFFLLCSTVWCCNFDSFVFVISASHTWTNRPKYICWCCCCWSSCVKSPHQTNRRWWNVRLLCLYFKLALKRWRKKSKKIP